MDKRQARLSDVADWVRSIEVKSPSVAKIDSYVILELLGQIEDIKGCLSLTQPGSRAASDLQTALTKALMALSKANHNA